MRQVPLLTDPVLRLWLPDRMVRFWGDLIRACAWGVLFVATVGFARVYARMIRLTIEEPGRSDFTIFYTTARAAVEGLPLYTTMPEAYGLPWSVEQLGNLNPPHFQIVAWPLGLLAYPEAVALWALAGAAGLAFSAALVVRAAGIELTWPRLAGWGVLVLGSAAFVTVAVTGELTFLLLVPFTLAWREARRGRWAAAGAWLGLCASLKLFFLIFAPWLAWHRRWRALAAGAAAAAAAVAAGMLLFGPGAYADWRGAMGGIGWWWLPMNASWLGFFSRVLEGGRDVVAPWPWPAAVRPLALTGAAVVGAGTLWAVRRAPAGPPDVDRQVLLLLLAALLVSPLGWIYYVPLALGPMIGWLAGGALARASRAGRWALVAGVAGLYVPQEITAAAAKHAWLTPLVASAYFWGVLGTWTVVMARSRQIPAGGGADA